MHFLPKEGIIFRLGIEWHEKLSSARKRNSMWPTRVGHRSRTTRILLFLSFFPFFHFYRNVSGEKPENTWWNEHVKLIGWKGRGGQGGGGRRERAVERVEGRNLVNAPYITVMPALSRNYICDALVAYLHVTANDIFQWREADRGYVPRCQASRTNRAPIIEEFGIQYPPIAAPFTRVLGSQFAPFASRLVKPAIV